MNAKHRDLPVFAVAGWRRHESMIDHAHASNPAGDMQSEAVCGAKSDALDEIHPYDHAARRCRRCWRIVCENTREDA